MAYSIEDNLAAETATFGDRPLSDTMQILMYELGAIARDVIHAQSQVDPVVARSQYADSLAELSDLMTQAGMFYKKVLPLVGPATAELYRSFDDLIQLGRERQVERMQEWLERRSGQADSR